MLISWFYCTILTIFLFPFPYPTFTCSRFFFALSLDLPKMGLRKKLVNAAIVFFAFTILNTLRNSSSQYASKALNVLVSRDSSFNGYDTHGMSNVSELSRRDDYSCGPGNPCSNGACCGASGYCGYGSTYCGTGCTSNCNAVAECGIDASPAGKTCPLNTCCSQYGFCGTTKVGKKGSIRFDCRLISARTFAQTIANPIAF